MEEPDYFTWRPVLRDDHGQVLLLAWGTLERCEKEDVADARASFKALKIVVVHSNKPVILESDCRVLVKELYLLT